jgi:hypothetical protein
MQASRDKRPDSAKVLSRRKDYKFSVWIKRPQSCNRFNQIGFWMIYITAIAVRADMTSCSSA